jgi:ketosteroid isomerase-like protein
VSDVRELLDRQAIGDLLSEYAACVDDHDWKGLAERVMTEDVVCYYEGFGTFEGRDAVLAFLDESMSPIAASQHLLSNLQVTLDGDRARTRVNLWTRLVAPQPGGELRITQGAVYRHVLVRGSAGWRIHRLDLKSIWRVEETVAGSSLPLQDTASGAGAS